MTQTARTVAVVNMAVPRKAGWECWFLLMSDVHWDHKKCRRDLFNRHLREAQERRAGIIDAGDFNCLMQGRGDHRASRNAIRPEHNVEAYGDAVINDSIDALEEYAWLMTMRGKGNHELRFDQNYDTDVVGRIAQGLRDRTGAPVPTGGYDSHIIFRAERNSERTSLKYAAHHGSGGGGYASKGTSGFVKRQIITPDADVLHLAHTHECAFAEDVAVSVDRHGKTTRRNRYLVRTPGYKDAYEDGHAGFEVERGHGPKPLGSMWMRIWWPPGEALRVTMSRAD